MKLTSSLRAIARTDRSSHREGHRDLLVPLPGVRLAPNWPVGVVVQSGLRIVPGRVVHGWRRGFGQAGGAATSRCPIETGLSQTPAVDILHRVAHQHGAVGTAGPSRQITCTPGWARSQSAKSAASRPRTHPPGDARRPCRSAPLYCGPRRSATVDAQHRHPADRWIRQRPDHPAASTGPRRPTGWPAVIRAARPTPTRSPPTLPSGRLPVVPPTPAICSTNAGAAVDVVAEER